MPHFLMETPRGVNNPNEWLLVSISEGSTLLYRGRAIPQTLTRIGVARIGTTPTNLDQSIASIGRWSERPDGSRWVRARTKSARLFSTCQSSSPTRPCRFQSLAAEFVSNGNLEGDTISPSHSNSHLDQIPKRQRGLNPAATVFSPVHRDAR